MTDRELLIELLAIKLYETEHHPPQKNWHLVMPETRQTYRNIVTEAHKPGELYDE